MRYDPLRPPALTLTTGPVDAYPAVLRGLSMPVLYDYDPAFQAQYAAVNARAGEAMGCSRTRPLILHGEPVLGLEAAAASLIGPGDIVLNLVSGVYGAGFGFWARRYAAEVVELSVPYDRVIDPQAVAALLRARPDVTIVSLCHHDTPSGTINPAEAIGAVVAAHGALFLVDAVSSFGGMAIDPEGCEADVFVTGPNKCLGCPPGLSLLAVSPRAWAHMKANPRAPRESMLSLLDWENAAEPEKPFPFTPSVAEINGLAAALDQYLSEGPQAVWARHALTARATRAGIQAAGLALWPAEEAFASPTCTAVRLPEGTDETALRAAIRARYGVMLSSGRGETHGKLIRIGHMGPTAQPVFALAAVAAVVGGLRQLGHALDAGAGCAAALAVIDGG